ncbi:MAG TPA: DedA family protein [Pyrinomonadaceae bacterium]|jgi:membrane-associated protein|nr:DedA family protein [Pyrinomonadaceae bacterium]
MNSLQFLSHVLEAYGLYGVFFLVLIEGDVTLLLAGVLAHSAFFGDYSFARLLIWGTLGGVAADNLAYAGGRGFAQTVRNARFYRRARPRVERLTDRFGTLSIFLTKYIWGLRWASCIFYGASQMAYLRFLVLSTASCFVWVFVLSGFGYFFSSAVAGLIVDFRRVSKILLVVVIVIVGVVYLQKRLRLSKKVEAVMPERLQEIEQVAIEGLKEIKEEFKETIHLKTTDRGRDGDSTERIRPGTTTDEK